MLVIRWYQSMSKSGADFFHIIFCFDEYSIKIKETNTSITSGEFFLLTRENRDGFSEGNFVKKSTERWNARWTVPRPFQIQLKREGFSPSPTGPKLNFDLIKFVKSFKVSGSLRFPPAWPSRRTSPVLSELKSGASESWI